MFTLPPKKDGFRFLLPKELIPEEIEEKYTKILVDAKSFITKPIDFLNETIQKVQVLGIQSGTIEQQQTDSRSYIRLPKNVYGIQGGSSPHMYRNANSPLALIDKTINIDFRHTLGYVNYFMMFESFWYMFARDYNYFKDLDFKFTIDLLNDRGSIYSRIVLSQPLMDGMDMLDFDFTQPLGQGSTFRCIFKYSDIDYEFLQGDTDLTYKEEDIPYREKIDKATLDKLKQDQSYNRYPYTEKETSTPNSRILVEKYVDTSKTLVDENGNPLTLS